MSFPEEIKHARKELLLSQTEFAKELGVSYATVNRWESGKNKPTYKALRTIDQYCKKKGIVFAAKECLEDTQQ